jgi:hypothetical protein
LVMRGLDPRIKAGVRRIISEGAAWMPDSRPGMTGGSAVSSQTAREEL